MPAGWKFFRVIYHHLISLCTVMVKKKRQSNFRPISSESYPIALIFGRDVRHVSPNVCYDFYTNRNFHVGVMLISTKKILCPNLRLCMQENDTVSSRNDEDRKTTVVERLYRIIYQLISVDLHWYWYIVSEVIQCRVPFYFLKRSYVDLNIILESSSSGGEFGESHYCSGILHYIFACRI